MATPPGHNEVVKLGARRLIAAGTVVVAIGVLGGAVAGWWRWDTDRRPHVGRVVADLNAAVADVVVAAGDGAAVAVSPVVESARCRLGLHQGGLFSARADLYTDTGGEDELIAAIAQRLPARYAAGLGPSIAGVRTLRGALGDGVTVSVSRVSPGWLAVVARSACSLGRAATPSPPAAATAATTALTDLLGRLGTRPATLTDQRVSCAAGGQVDTVGAVSEPVDSAGLAARLTGIVPAGAHQFTAGESNRVVYRAGAVSVIVAASDDGTAVTAQYTTVC
jgi:hypothetical protein